SQLHHAPWHGITWVDFSFAAYVMLMGLAVRLSLKRYREDESNNGGFYGKVLRRTLVLFLIGCLYNGGFAEPWPNIRVCGVLQRMAINIGVVWDAVFPINKPLWTSSYVMVCAGIGSIVLGVCYLIAEVLKWQRLLFPFEVIGRNLLTAFLVMGMIPLGGLAMRFCGGDVAMLLGPAAPFAAAMTETALVWLLLLFLYRKNIAIRI
ncbi:MAG: hypothetical protein HQ582_31850, partial [Planctomycetes bacterium]|nr:hypothetical protein [Planctomycetota bacterium]